MIRTTQPSKQKHQIQYIRTKGGTWYCTEHEMCVAPGTCQSQIDQGESKCQKCGGVTKEEYTISQREIDAHYAERYEGEEKH